MIFSSIGMEVFLGVIVGMAFGALDRVRRVPGSSETHYRPETSGADAFTSRITNSTHSGRSATKSTHDSGGKPQRRLRSKV